MTNDTRSWEPLAGPYAARERWMLERLLEDLRRSGKDYQVRESADGLVVYHYRTPKPRDENGKVMK